MNNLKGKKGNFGIKMNNMVYKFNLEKDEKVESYLYTTSGSFVSTKGKKVEVVTDIMADICLCEIIDNDTELSVTMLVLTLTSDRKSVCSKKVFSFSCEKNYVTTEFCEDIKATFQSLVDKWVKIGFVEWLHK